MGNLAIIGVGMYVPEKVLTNEQIEAWGIGASAKWICENTGVLERRIAADNQSSSDLASLAAKDAISRAELDPWDIDLIVMSTLTQDYLLPQTSSVVKQKIGAVRAACFDVQAACAGFMFALITALNYGTLNEEINNILVIGSDTASKFIDWSNRKTCSTSGDGAGAVVIRKNAEQSSIKCSILKHLSMKSLDCALLHAYYGQIPSDSHAYYNFDGRYLYDVVKENMPQVIRELLNKANWKVDEVDLFVLPQVNRNLVLDVSKIVGFSECKTHIIAHKYGYTYNSCIPLVLYDALESGKLRKNDKVVLVGAGAGNYFAGLALEWNY